MSLSRSPTLLSHTALLCLDLLTVLYVLVSGLFYLFVLFTEQARYGPVGTALVVLVGGTPLVAAWLFHLILRDARDTDPFQGRNVKRLNGMAVLVLLPWLLTSGVEKLGQWVGPRHELGIPDPGMVPVNGLTLALLLFGLAGVFARGVQLREEQALTV